MVFERRAFSPQHAWPCLLASLLCACAVYEPPAIQSSSGATSTITAVALVDPDEGQQDRNLFRDALAEALTSRGIAVSETAPTVGDFSISVSDADIALLASEAGKTDKAPSELAGSRKPHWTDGCKAARIRATLTMFDRASGGLTKTSTAHATVCQGDTAPYGQMAETLISDTLND